MNVSEALKEAAIVLTDDKELIRQLLLRIERTERILFVMLQQLGSKMDLRCLEGIDKEPEYTCNTCDEQKLCSVRYYLKWDNVPACLGEINKMKFGERAWA